MDTDHTEDKYLLSAPLGLEECEQLLYGLIELEIDAESRKIVQHCRNYLDKKLENLEGAIYGINTGFGSLCKVQIPAADLAQLQENLVMSHAAGVGDYAPTEVVRLMMLHKIKSLSLGHSGVTEELLDRLVLFFNEGFIPVVHEQGSLGASGDLVPLAEMSLPLLGLGNMYSSQHEAQFSAVEAHEYLGIKPLKLKSKEGLALLNGTQFMTGYATHTLLELQQLMGWAITISALSLEAFQAKVEPFHPAIHKARGLNGQQEIAASILELLEGSPLLTSSLQQVQDPYSFRCIPQVLGASLDSIDYVSSVIIQEMNAATDNPLIFPDEDLILSGGNFHGQPLALVLDQLAIAIAEIGNISERRTYQHLHGLRGLPEFLIQNNGLNSGLMIPQYVAASLVSQNKQYCTPASVDNVTSCNGQEDHVSMGANAAIKAHKVLENVKTILAIELLTVNQAMALRNADTSAILQQVLDFYRTVLPTPYITHDNAQIMHEVIELTKTFLHSEDSPVSLSFSAQ